MKKQQRKPAAKPARTPAKRKPAGRAGKAPAKGKSANSRAAAAQPGPPSAGAESGAPVNCSKFADAVIEGMGWPEEFLQRPLMRSGLEFALAWAFQKYRRGDFGPISPGNFTARALDIADNLVTGPCDLITTWEGRQGIRTAYQDAVRTAFAAVLEAEAPAP